MNYGFNIGSLINQMLSYIVRKPRMFAWLSTLLKPAQDLHTAFIAFRAQQLKDVTINSQVNRLTQALRDKFEDEGIYIIHPSDYLDSAYMYLFTEEHAPEWDYLFEEEHEPVEFDYLFDEYNPDYDFIVRIPVALVAISDAAYTFVAKYTMAGRRFKIETY